MQIGQQKYAFFDWFSEMERAGKTGLPESFSSRGKAWNFKENAILQNQYFIFEFKSSSKVSQKLICCPVNIWLKPVYVDKKIYVFDFDSGV